MRYPAIAAALLAAAVLAAGVLTLSSSRSAADPALDERELQFIALLNEYRAENGRGPLTPIWPLTNAADWHANDMATGGYVSHIDSLGRPPLQRAQDFGYSYSVGENIGAGGAFSDPALLLEAFKGSPGHNNQMLRSEWKAIGVGTAYNPNSYYGLYWSIGFGNVIVKAITGPATPAPTPTPTPTVTPTPTPTPAPTPSPTPLPTTTPVPTPVTSTVRGDTDCDFAVGSLDALAVLQEGAGLDTDAECLENGDANCDGVINSLDALAILKWVVSQPLIVEDCSPIGQAA